MKKRIAKFVFFLSFSIALMVFTDYDYFFHFFVRASQEAENTQGNFSLAIKMYKDLMRWGGQKTREAYENGTEFYVQDWNLNIEMKPNGSVYVKYNISVVNRNISAIYNFHKIAYRFSCFDYPKPSGLNVKTTKCQDSQSIEKISYEFAKKEIKSPERSPLDGIYSYSLPYLLVDNKTGNLTYYKMKIKPTEEDLMSEKQMFFSIFNGEHETTTTVAFSLNFNYTGTSHCLRFPIPRYSNVTMNITTFSKVVNYTFGRKEFILKNYTANNSSSVIAKIKVYPCCGIKNVGLQTAEVCSA